MTPRRANKKLFVSLGAVAVVAIVLIFAAALLLSPTMSSDPDACVNQSISAGSKGHCVSDLQTMLNWSLYGIDGPNYKPVTGTFSSQTTSLVKQFQHDNNLPTSGKPTKQTWGSLCGGGSGAPAGWITAAKDAGCK